MTAIKLNIQDRKQLRADAHHLSPVVMIGNDGLTAAVKREVDAALNAHGLIKVRVFSDDRTAREAMLVELSEEFYSFCGAKNLWLIKRLMKIACQVRAK
jgi:putative YhbY family RNA-binding protein